MVLSKGCASTFLRPRFLHFSRKAAVFCCNCLNSCSVAAMISSLLHVISSILIFYSSTAERRSGTAIMISLWISSIIWPIFGIGLILIISRGCYPFAGKFFAKSTIASQITLGSVIKRPIVEIVYRYQSLYSVSVSLFSAVLLILRNNGVSLLSSLLEFYSLLFFIFNTSGFFLTGDPIIASNDFLAAGDSNI